MIRDHLVPQLQERFPNVAFTFNGPSNPVVSAKSPCQALGELQIYDDDDEVTVCFGDVTHGHFGCYDETLDTSQKEKKIAENVIEFLDSVFKDRVIMWRALGGMAGGMRVLKAGESLPRPSVLKQQFVWSRELK